MATVVVFGAVAMHGKSLIKNVWITLALTALHQHFNGLEACEAFTLRMGMCRQRKDAPEDLWQLLHDGPQGWLRWDNSGPSSIFSLRLV